MDKYVYGVEKFDGEWVVCRFNSNDKKSAVEWVLRGPIFGTVRWLCHRKTAIAMAGEQALKPENLIIWED